MNAARCALLALALACASSVARADDSRFRVTTPERCGDAEEFHHLLQEFLSRSAVAAASNVSAVVQVAELPGAFELTLEISDGGALESRRVIRHPTNCALLLRIAALIVSMSLDPDAEELPVELLSTEGLSVSSAELPEETETNAPSVEEPPAITPEPEPEAEAPTPSTSTAPRVTGRVHALVGVDAAGTSGVAPSFAVGGGILHRRLLVDASLVVDGPNRTNIDGDPNYRTRVLAMTLEVASCVRLTHARLAFAACPRLDVGMVQAVVESVASRPKRLEARVRASAEARVGFAIVPRRLELELRTFVGVDLRTPSFGLGANPLVPRIDGGASLGVALAFP